MRRRNQVPWARVHVTVQTRCPSVPGPQRLRLYRAESFAFLPHLRSHQRRGLIGQSQDFKGASLPLLSCQFTARSERTLAEHFVCLFFSCNNFFFFLHFNSSVINMRCSFLVCHTMIQQFRMLLVVLGTRFLPYNSVVDLEFTCPSACAFKVYNGWVLGDARSCVTITSTLAAL